jgi:hypothetical protein
MVGTLLQACDKAACMRGVSAMDATLKSAMGTAVMTKRPKSLQAILDFLALSQIPRPKLNDSLMRSCPKELKEQITGHDLITSCLDNINAKSENADSFVYARQPEGIWLSDRVIMGIVLQIILGDDVD